MREHRGISGAASSTRGRLSLREPSQQASCRQRRRIRAARVVQGSGPVWRVLRWCTQITVGIDVSKARLDAHVDPTGASCSFDNDKCGRRALRNWALKEGAGRAALEPTGHFHRPLHQCLTDAGIEVVAVNPRRTCNFAGSIGNEAKNDLEDAEVLACSPACSSAR